MLWKHLWAICYLSSFTISNKSKFMLWMGILYICHILLYICFWTCSLAIFLIPCEYLVYLSLFATLVDLVFLISQMLEGRSYKLQFPWIGVVNRSQADINKSVDMIAARRREREYFANSPEYKHLAHRMGSEHLGKMLSKAWQLFSSFTLLFGLFWERQGWYRCILALDDSCSMQ